MSEENENPEVDADESQPLLAGERLAYARREQKIPILDVAKELHLDEHKVRALESNEFDAIGAPVFAKGHLRKYAQLLKVDSAEIMSDYYEMTRSQASAPALAVRSKPRQSISPGPWLLLIAVIAAIGTAYWWYLIRDERPDAGNSADRVVGVVSPMQGEPSQSESEVESVGDENSDNVEPPAINDVEDNSEAAAADVVTEDVVATAEMQLSITYNGDSWTEISDANGRRLFFDLGKEGRTVELSGEAPFNVLFGDAANVSLRVDGADYQLPPADRRGTVRVTIIRP